MCQASCTRSIYRNLPLSATLGSESRYRLKKAVMMDGTGDLGSDGLLYCTIDRWTPEEPEIAAMHVKRQARLLVQFHGSSMVSERATLPIRPLKRKLARCRL